MKAKRFFLATAALIVVGGWWLAPAAWRARHHPVTSETSSDLDVGLEAPNGQPTRGHTLRPPDPNRRFRDLTPEQRVKLARNPEVGG